MELPEHGVLRVLVDLRLVLDVFGTIGVTQGAQGLVVVVVGRREAGHHQSLRVPAEGVLVKKNKTMR